MTNNVREGRCISMMTHSKSATLVAKTITVILLCFVFISCSEEPEFEENPPSSAQPNFPSALDVSVEPPIITLSNSARIIINGGQAPYSFNLKSGSGSVSTSGIFKPSQIGMAIIEVNDQKENYLDIAIQTLPVLELKTPSATLMAGTQTQLEFSGGVPPLKFYHSGTGGSIDVDGLFRAPFKAGRVRVKVVDKIANENELLIDVVGLSEIFSGGSSNCTLYSAGFIKCWGANLSGQLGTENTIQYGSSPFQMGTYLPIVNVGTNRKVKSLAMGQSHVCALLDNEMVKCWGSNSYGQLGLESTASYGRSPGSMGDQLPYVNLGKDRKAKKIFAGHFFSCAILENNDLKCWGQNNYGQLGAGNTDNLGSQPNQMGDRLPSINLGTDSSVVSMALGYFHSCALFQNGRVKCWGRSNLGQTGLEHTQTIGISADQMGDQLPYVNLGTNRKAVSIVAGIYHTCALLDDAGVKCWGRNSQGQLGIGSSINRGSALGQMGDALPYVNFGPNMKALSLAANYDSTCARLDNGSVKCWGLNESGELGVETKESIGTSTLQLGSSWPSVSLGPEMTALKISAGRNFFCALGSEGRVKCWGNSRSGALGNGSVIENLGDQTAEMGSSLPFLDL